MKAKLTSNDPFSPNLEFEIDQWPVVIGRNGTSDLHVDNRWTSEQHCEVDQIDGQLVVRDLDSEHGTLVNGTSVNGRPTDASRLKSGDKLTIGVRSFKVSYRQSKRPGRANGTSADGGKGKPKSKEAGG